MIANIIFREHSIYIKSFLELFPLKFKDSLTENQYFFHPLKLNSSSHYLFTYILALISFTSVFLTLSVAFFTDIIPLKSLSTFYFLTSIIFLVLIAWLISLTFSMSYKISSYRLHFVSFTFLLTVRCNSFRSTLRKKKTSFEV
jgi:magnesium-transporting ATPase (P-type)